MYRAAVLAGLSLCIAACAAPPPQAHDGVAASPPPAAAPVDDDTGVIEVVDVPQATAVTDLPTLRSQQERICHHERRTGSNRVVRVCRTRAEIARDELESKELFDELHRSQREYNR